MNDRESRSLFPGVLLCVVALDLFALLAWQIRGNTPLTRFDEEVAGHLHGAAMAHPGWRNFFGIATHAGDTLPLYLACGGLSVLLCFRAYWLALGSAAAGLGGYLLDSEMKELFHRPRPLHSGARSWSFPSGHALGAMIFYGLLAFLLWRVLRQGWSRIVMVAVLVLIVVTVGFSRMYLCRHYLSDVLGGFALGCGWLAGCLVTAAALDRLRQGKAQGGPMPQPAELDRE
jgi:undecaprenyl-diphosphatase